MYFYDIHVFLSRSEGYSLGLASEVPLTEDEAIAEAARQNRFTEEGDGDYVDVVDEITEKEYREIFGEV